MKFIKQAIYLCCIAEDNGAIVGHIMFSPVSLSGHPTLRIMGLAPMAVSPEHQRKGIGSGLVRAGLEECKQLGFGGVVVLGHPAYYPRFGFVSSVRFGIGCEYDVPEEVFMVEGGSESDQKLLDDVAEYGWHVMKVLDQRDTPGWAYSNRPGGPEDRSKSMVFHLRLLRCN